MPGRFVGLSWSGSFIFPGGCRNGHDRSVVLASRSHSKRTAAAVSAYAITEKVFVEYKGKGHRRTRKTQGTEDPR